MQRYYRLGLPLAGILLILSLACGVNDLPEGVADGPCPGESGFGARVAGADEQVDVCVHDSSVVTVFTADGWYDVTARMTASDGTVYEFFLLFPHHTSSRALNVTGNLAEARSDQNGAWFHYVETPPGGPALESIVVSPGTFRLGYSDTDVVAGLFEGLGLEMQTVDGGDPSGTRTVVEGFYSILTDVKEPRASN
jgi:hypothetical protein